MKIEVTPKTISFIILIASFLVSCGVAYHEFCILKADVLAIQVHIEKEKEEKLEEQIEKVKRMRERLRKNRSASPLTLTIPQPEGE